MGLSGPPPTPFQILRARDSRLTERVASELPVEVRAPEMSEWLPAEAREIWAKTVPILLGMRVLTAADGPALERYCFLLWQWRRTAAQIQADGMTYVETVSVGSEGLQTKEVPKLLPVVKAFDILCTQLAKVEMLFGLTPSARSRIVAPPQDQGKKKTGDKRRFLNMG